LEVLFQAENQIHCPASASVRAWTTAVDEQLAIVAPGICEGVCKDRQQVKLPVGVDAAGQLEYVAGSPAGIDRYRPKWVAANIPEQLALGPPLSQLGGQDIPCSLRVMGIARRVSAYGNDRDGRFNGRRPGFRAGSPKNRIALGPLKGGAKPGPAARPIRELFDRGQGCQVAGPFGEAGQPPAAGHRE
jgi:hypothetical protein